LADVGGDERRAHPGKGRVRSVIAELIAAPGLDLDDFGTHQPQQVRGEGPRHHVAEVRHADSIQRLLHAVVPHSILLRPLTLARASRNTVNPSIPTSASPRALTSASCK